MIFKYIHYIVNSKKVIENPDELISDSSLGFIEGFFITSFITLGLITALVSAAAYFYSSTILGIFALFFILILSFDIFIFVSIKKFIKKITHNIKYNRQEATVISGRRIVDVE